jgi:hypothetical protein
MSVETKKVLDLLAEGKISSADAERLLDKLAATPGDDPSASPAAAAVATKKYLRVLVQRPNGDDVNVRLPLNFVRSGVKLAGVLPPSVLEKLNAEGVDLKLFTPQLEESLDELNIDMETKSGKHVRMFCE